MAAAIQDPFYVVKEELLQNLTAAQVLFGRWKDIYDSGKIYDNYEFESTQIELVNQLRNIEWDLEDMEESISIAEANKQKFRIEPSEIQNRRQFVTDTRQKVHTMRRTVTDPAVAARKEQAQRQALMAASQAPERDRFAKVQAAVDEDNQRFVEGVQQQQQLLIRQQDADLEQLEGTLERLGEIGRAIHAEAELHNQLLEETNEEADRVLGRLQGAMQEVKKTIEAAKGNGFLCAIVVLVLVLVVLIVLVFTIK